MTNLLGKLTQHTRYLISSLFLIVIGITGCTAGPREISEEERWVQLQFSGPDTMQLDRRSLFADSGFVRTWLRTSFVSPQIGSRRTQEYSYAFAMTQVDFDCKRKRIRIGVAVHYDSTWNQVGADPVSLFAEGWTDAYPGTPGEQVVDSACAVAKRDDVLP